MSERRAHWTDELIETVRHRIQGFGYDALDEITHGVIAVVEDWHKAKRASRDRTHSDECWRWHEECAEALIEAQQARLGKLSMQLMWYPDWRRGLVKAETAIQRVRELHHPTVDTVDCGEGGVEDVEHCAECGHIYEDDGGCPTIRALNGDSDE